MLFLLWKKWGALENLNNNNCKALYLMQDMRTIPPSQHRNHLSTRMETALLLAQFASPLAPNLRQGKKCA